MCFYFVTKGLESYKGCVCLRFLKGEIWEIHVLFYDGIFNDFSV